MAVTSTAPSVSSTIRLEDLRAVIFDMDGVVTDTASIHAAAWKRLFDEYLTQRSAQAHRRFRPFDIDRDYRQYVDGKPRYDGVRDFLRSRSIVLSEGETGDAADRESVRGLGNRKDSYFLEHLRKNGVKAFPGTIELVKTLHSAGLRSAIISASRNLTEVLRAAGISELFDTRVDGVEAERLGLKGKPDPAVFLEAAHRLGVTPPEAAVVEDAFAGVEAGRRGGFRLVVGVDRSGHAEELRARGADVVVRDLGELLAWHAPLPTAADVGAPFTEPTADPAWLLEIVGFDPLAERDVESWLTVANGRTGTRGTVEEGSEESSPATFVAGVYGTSEAGRVLISGPQWWALSPRIGREALDLDRGDTVEHRRILDLRQGMLFRVWKQRLLSGADVTFRSVRFASLADRDVLVLEATSSAPVSMIHLAGAVPPPPEAGEVERIGVRLEGQRHVSTAWGRKGGAASFAVQTEERDGRVTRLVGVGRSAPGSRAPTAKAEAALEQARQIGVGDLRDRHRSAWEARWNDTDVVIGGDLEAQRALRFALYHLISSADPESDLASVAARGLSGPGYSGHVFWDTEAFVLPFFIFTHPPTARALLAYRYRTLPAARARAAALGHRGALFPWESADTGEDVTPTHGVGPDGQMVPILTGLQEIHISADVAWATWRYWEATHDEEFLVRMGAEILFETARFWASRARRGRDGRYHIAPVIGSDEYHEGVTDNAFTNVMARWNLERALEIVGVLRERDRAEWRALRSRVSLRQHEIRRWTAVQQGLVDGFDDGSRLYEQFHGFFALEDMRVAELGQRPFAADVVLGPERAYRAQVVKQADVLMLIHMLGDSVSDEVAAANYSYYEPRTSHGSSLSPPIHAAVAARLDRLDEALSYLRMAAAVDLGNGMGNAAQGVHMAAMGGLWQAAVMGFGGVRPAGTALGLDPKLPDAWSGLEFPLRWRDTRLEVAVRGDGLSIVLDGPVDLALGTGPAQHLEPGRYLAQRQEKGWSSVRAAP